MNCSVSGLPSAFYLPCLFYVFVLFFFFPPNVCLSGLYSKFNLFYFFPFAILEVIHSFAVLFLVNHKIDTLFFFFGSQSLILLGTLFSSQTVQRPYIPFRYSKFISTLWTFKELLLWPLIMSVFWTLSPLVHLLTFAHIPPLYCSLFLPES